MAVVRRSLNWIKVTNVTLCQLALAWDGMGSLATDSFNEGWAFNSICCTHHPAGTSGVQNMQHSGGVIIRSETDTQPVLVRFAEMQQRPVCGEYCGPGSNAIVCWSHKGIN